MFYSQTYLARKGPLGTVWCAAHLQHKLKKSHYASTDIPSTVERIIFPEVPIALRMSGHLLLGVVRIYSKKVEYLHHDCNILWVSLRNALRAPDVNLPENANQAQFNAITLPETFALDALDINDDLSLTYESPDHHLRTEEEITLKDQYPVNSDLYVRITFNDDPIPDSSNSVGSLHGDVETMQIDSPTDPNSPPLAIRDSGPSQHVETSGKSQEEGLPPREILRDRHDDDFLLSSPVLRPHVENVNFEPNVSPLRDTSEKQIETPQSVHITTPEMELNPSPQRSGPSSPPPGGAFMESASFGANISTDLVLRPSPSPEPQPQPQPQPRQRKRKQLFDETLVLNNTFYKKALNDPSDLVKKRKKLPSSALEMWRITNKKKKEQVFLDPLISGMSMTLQNLLSKDLTVLNPNLLVSEETQPESTAAETREPSPSFVEDREQLRSPDRGPGPDYQVLPSPLRLAPQTQGDEEIPTIPRIPSMVSVPEFVSPVNTESDLGMFTRSADMDMDTPIINYDGSAGLSDIPELRNSMVSDDLSFLEEDSSSPSDSQGGSEGDTMSVRTRAVAQYLKNHSPSSKTSDGTDDLSLHAILDGRRRKLAARMFYETLVLKDRGLIDVKQEEPYGDITLKLSKL